MKAGAVCFLYKPFKSGPLSRMYRESFEGGLTPSCRSCRETPQNELVSGLNCYGYGYCLFNESSGLGRICPVKIAKRDDRHAVGIEDIKARVGVPPIGHVLHFSNAVLHWLCLRLVALGQRRPPRRSNSYPRFLSRLLRPSKKYCTGTSSVSASW